MHFTHEHLEIQKTLKRFIDAEINPHADEWEAAEMFPAHEVFKKMGKLGLLGLTKPEAYGGAGLDYSYAMAMAETLGHIDCGGVPMAIGTGEADKRADRPKRLDLRDSGAIEKDTFGVLFIWSRAARPGNGDASGDCEIIVAKHRQGGSCGPVPMKFHGPSTRFFEVAQEPDGFESDFNDGRY